LCQRKFHVMSTKIDYRALYCTSPQSTACPAPCTSWPCESRSGFRIAQLQALNQGPNAGAAGLRLSDATVEMALHVYSRCVAFASLRFGNEDVRFGEKRNRESESRRRFPSWYTPTCITSFPAICARLKMIRTSLTRVENGFGLPLLNL